MKIVFIKFIVLSAMIFLMACNKPLSKNPAELTMQKNEQLSQSTASAKEKWQTATIKYMDFEGGFFGIETKEGEKLLPINLEAQYRQEGAIIKIQGHIIDDMMTTQQWGTPFQITKIELIKAGSNIRNSQNNNPIQ